MNFSDKNTLNKALDAIPEAYDKIVPTYNANKSKLLIRARDKNGDKFISGQFTCYSDGHLDEAIKYIQEYCEVNQLNFQLARPVRQNLQYYTTNMKGILREQDEEHFNKVFRERKPENAEYFTVITNNGVSIGINFLDSEKKLINSHNYKTPFEHKSFYKQIEELGKEAGIENTNIKRSAYRLAIEEPNERFR